MQSYSFPQSKSQPANSAKEEENLLDIEQRFNKRRNTSMINRMFRFALWVIVYSLLAVFLIRIIHFVLPNCWHWITKDTLNEINNLLSSGLIGALVGRKLDLITKSKKPTEDEKVFDI